MPWRRADRWPGFIAGVHALVPEKAAEMPDRIHVFEPDSLAAVFQAAGFAIEHAEFFDRPVSTPKGAIQRRSVGLIARRT